MNRNDRGISVCRIMIVGACWLLTAAVSLFVFQAPCPAAQSDAGKGLPNLIPSPSTSQPSSEQFFPEWWGSPPAVGEVIPCREPGKCVQCHDEQSRMDPPHAIPCAQCHGGYPEAVEEKEAHSGLIADPGDLRFVDRTCGKCHPEEARRVRISPMAVATRMINHTRFAFGAQKSSTRSHATVTVDSAGLKEVPHPSLSGNLGDDLLRRSCLRCHLHTKGSSRWGEHRGKGCSACHVPYPNGRNGKPRPHTLVRSGGINACLKCHNSNHVGADYVGLFEKDFHRGFQSPFVSGFQPPTIYGAEQHRLSPDVHFKAGMECMDCHTLDEVHGDGKASDSSGRKTEISCESCHVRADHPAVLKQQDGKVLLMRGKGRLVPAWDPGIVPHSVNEHKERLRCSACHAAWSFQDYGLHLMLEERSDYWKWAPTKGQNDPQVQELLDRAVGTEVDIVPPPAGLRPSQPMEDWKPPSTRDWISGEPRPGAWFSGYTARRWEMPPLGLDGKGKIAVMRPMHQYVISHVDAEERLLKDREIPMTGAGKPALIFNPYEPHTTAKTGRPCHECHGNPKAAGLGEGFTGIKKPGFSPVSQPEEKIPGHKFRWDALVDESGNPLQSSTHPTAGPLDGATFKRLLNPSPRHKALWHEYLEGKKAPPR